MPLKRVMGRAAVGAFSAANYFVGPSAADPPGGSLGSVPFTCAAVVAVRMAPGLAQECIVSHDNSLAGRGWNIMYEGAVDQITWRCVDGAAGLHALGVSAAGLVKGNMLCVLGCLDAAQARAQIMGVAVAEASAGGYTAPDAARALTVGNRSNSFNLPSANFELVAFLGTDAVALSAAELTAAEAWLIDAVEQGRDDLSGVPVLGAQADLVYYDARDVVLAGGGTTGPWECRQGNGSDLTRVGAPEGEFRHARFV